MDSIAKVVAVVTIGSLGGCGLGKERDQLKQKQYSEAIASLKRKLEAKPSCGECAFLLAVARIATGNAAVAVEPLAVAERELEEPARRQAQGLRARALRESGDDAAAAKLELGLAAGLSGWQPVLARTPGAAKTMLVTARTATASCEKKARCHDLTRGEVLEILAARKNAVEFARRLRVEETGWMYEPALQRRRYWSGTPYKPLLFGEERARVPNELEPWLFKSRPPDCPPAIFAAYWIWMTRNHPSEFLDRDARSTVRETGVRHVGRRLN